jgi:hypothetical protein
MNALHFDLSYGKQFICDSHNIVYLISLYFN